jgi:hypothetical protein
MSTTPTSKVRRVALITLLASSCTSWRLERRPVPAPLNGSRVLPEALVDLRSGEEIHLYDLTLQGDSIVGYTRRGAEEEYRRAVATRDVTSIVVKTVDGWKTLVAVIAGTLAVTTFLALVACASMNTY